MAADSLLSSSSHWATDYIGLPWQAGAQGPQSFDCWGLIRFILHRHYNIRLPAILVDERDFKALLQQFRFHPERQQWQAVSVPTEGDAVLLRQSRYPVHVGLWLDVDGGGILHCIQGTGVVFQKVQDLKTLGWSVGGFYHYCGNSKT